MHPILIELAKTAPKSAAVLDAQAAPVQDAILALYPPDKLGLAEASLDDDAAANSLKVRDNLLAGAPDIGAIGAIVPLAIAPHWK